MRLIVERGLLRMLISLHLRGACLVQWTALSTNQQDRKSTRLNSSHRCISYAVFCLKKKICVSIGTRVTRGSTLIAAIRQPLFITNPLLKNAFLRALYLASTILGSL